MRDIGKNIKTLREKRNITQEELAEKLFVTRQTVSNYETGRTRPDIDMLMKIAEVLEADMNALLYGPPQAVNRTRQIVTSCISVALVVLLVFLTGHLTDWAYQVKGLKFDARPLFRIHVFLKPALCLLGGWTLMQVVGTIIKLPELSKKASRIIVICNLVLLFGYVVAMVPAIFLTEGFPDQWWTIAYFILGVLPTQHTEGLYLFLFFFVGILFRLAGVGCHKASG